MNTTELLFQIDAELSRLNQARALLVGSNNGVRRGRPGRKKHTMSAEGRARIAAAQRRRWAKQKAGK